MTETMAVPVTGGGPTMFPLPDGAHALMRAPRTVAERLRRPVANARNRLGAMLPDLPPGTPEDEQKRRYGQAMLPHPELMNAVDDALIVALVSAWSFEFPVTMETVGDLPSPAYDALKEECERLAPELFPSFDPTPAPDSPTVPSTD